MTRLVWVYDPPDGSSVILGEHESSEAGREASTTSPTVASLRGAGPVTSAPGASRPLSPRSSRRRTQAHPLRARQSPSPCRRPRRRRHDRSDAAPRASPFTPPTPRSSFGSLPLTCRFVSAPCAALTGNEHRAKVAQPSQCLAPAPSTRRASGRGLFPLSPSFGRNLSDRASSLTPPKHT